MEPARPLDEGQDSVSSEPGTLGHLLYENQTHAPTSETVWVGIVRSIASGDQMALRELYDQTQRIVFTLVMRIINNPETAEEVTVDVFHDVWRKASTYDPANGSVVGWIMNQARSRAIDRLRYERRKKRAKTETSIAENGNRTHDSQTVLHGQEQGQRLRKALDMLNREERQAIEIAFFSELTYQEVASRLGQPLGTIKSRIRSGLGKLRDALAANSEDR